jgi:hypothetical protein
MLSMPLRQQQIPHKAQGLCRNWHEAAALVLIPRYESHFLFSQTPPKVVVAFAHILDRWWASLACLTQSANVRSMGRCLCSTCS